MSNVAVRQHHLHGQAGLVPDMNYHTNKAVKCLGKRRTEVVQKPVKVEPQVGIWWMTNLTNRSGKLPGSENAMVDGIYTDSCGFLASSDRGALRM